MIAQQLDSLNQFKDLYSLTDNALNSCIQAVEGRDTTIAMLRRKEVAQAANYEALQNVILHKNAQIGVLETQTGDLQGLIQKIDRKRKAQKFWSAAGGVLGGVCLGVLIGLIVK